MRARPCPAAIANGSSDCLANVARPPIAQDRLEFTADGRYRYDFRHAWNNGVHAVVLDPLDFSLGYVP
jgi:hypothetical protein